MNHNTINAKIVLKHNEKFNFENLLKRKIIKIQQKNTKKSVTTLNTHNNSNNSISSAIINHTNYNYLPNPNAKPKCILNNNNINNNNKIPSQFQKRSNSAFEDDYYKRHIKSNSNVYAKYISSSSSKKSNMKSPFKNIIGAGLINNTNGQFIANHLKNASIFSATLNNNKQLPKYHFEIKGVSKTTFPTKENSRKNSNEKDNNGKQIKKSTYANTSNSSLGSVVYTNTNNTKKDFKKINNEIKHDIENMIHQLNLKEKKKVDNKDLIKSEKDSSSKQLERIEEKKHKQKEPNNKDHKKKRIPDKDLDNTLNNNDSLLAYINSNIDNKQNLNNSSLNNSIDSLYSSTQIDNKFSYINKDTELLISYIRQYYSKHRQYPTTKMRFYKYGRLLGKGAFGKVNLSLHVLTGRLVAIKTINKSKLTSERQKAKIALETSIMKSLFGSNYIVKIFETFETQKHICIVMEYICAGDLLSFIRKRSKLTEPTAKYIFKQILLGLKFIHNRNIIHRDIKLDNILIDLDNNIKICDFGVSKRITKSDTMSEQCGTPAYMAPELLKGGGYQGFGADLWSAGVVLYAMLSGTVPFKGSDLKESHALTIKGVFKKIEGASPEANHLIKCLLEVDPKNRITVERALIHPWLVGVDVANNEKYNLFTNAERILLAKSNVDYRDPNNKEAMIENFSIKNIDTSEEMENKNGNTKSIILAPFNSSFSEKSDDSYNYNSKRKKSKNKKIRKIICDFDNPELEIKNNVIKFCSKARDLNRNYELNNNGEIDNGIIISPNDSNNMIYPHDISPYEDNSDKPFSPYDELEDSREINQNNKEKKEKGNVIYDKILQEMSSLGYNEVYVRECIENNEFNYATACYFLLFKYS